MNAAFGVLTWAVVLTALLSTSSHGITATMLVGLMAVAAVAQRWHLMAIATIAGVSMFMLGLVLYRFGGETVLDLGIVTITDDGLASGALYGMRLAASVLAIVVVAMVPMHALMLAAARWSPKSALLGALVARMGPLATRDARLLREEDQLRNGESTSRLDLASIARVTSAVVAGMFERAYGTATVVHMRGFGSPTIDTSELTDARLASPGAPRSLWAGSAAASVMLLATVLVARDQSPSAIAAAQIMAVLTTALMGALAITTRRSLSGSSPAATNDHQARDAATVAIAHRDHAARVDIANLKVSWPGEDTPSVAIEQLHIRPGSFVVVVGDSGSGKSTLALAIAGAHPVATGGHRSGSVMIDGHDTVAVAAAARPSIVGFAGQDPERQAIMDTCAEDVAFPLRSTRPASGLDAATAASLEATGVLPLARRSPHAISGGELQRVEIAAAIAAQPRLIVLDEPTSQLDADSAMRAWQGIDRLRATRGATVIAIEHDFEHVGQRMDRLIIMHDGRISDDIVIGDDDDRMSALSRARAAMRGRSVSPQPMRVAAAAAAHIVTIGPISSPVSAQHLLSYSTRLDLPHGSVVGMSGPSGSGKTTMLRQLAGLGGDRTHLMSAQGAPSSRAYVPQHAGPTLAGISIASVIADAAQHAGLSSPAMWTELANAGLSDIAYRHPMDVSVGQRQRAAILATTITHKDVWLLDEPTRGLDAKARNWLAWRVRQHQRSGGIAIIASHDAAFLDEVATHRLHLEAGTLSSLNGDATASTFTNTAHDHANPGGSA